MRAIARILRSAKRRCCFSAVPAAQPPDVLHRPAPRPVAVLARPVAAFGARRGTELDQVLDLEAAACEQRDPLAVGELEGDRLAGFLEALDALPVVDCQLLPGVLLAGRPDEV